MVQVVESFRQLDEHGSGLLDPASVLRGFERLQIKLSLTDAKTLLRAMAAPGNVGMLNYEELCGALRRFISKSSRPVKTDKNGQGDKAKGDKAKGAKQDAVLAFVLRKLFPHRQRVEKALLARQRGAKGAMAEAEFHRALGGIGISFTSTQRDAVFRAFDPLNRGKIKWRDFCEAVGRGGVSEDADGAPVLHAAGRWREDSAVVMAITRMVAPMVEQFTFDEVLSRIEALRRYDGAMVSRQELCDALVGMDLRLNSYDLFVALQALDNGNGLVCGEEFRSALEECRAAGNRLRADVPRIPTAGADPGSPSQMDGGSAPAPCQEPKQPATLPDLPVFSAPVKNPSLHRQTSGARRWAEVVDVNICAAVNRLLHEASSRRAKLFEDIRAAEAEGKVLLTRRELESMIKSAGIMLSTAELVRCMKVLTSKNGKVALADYKLLLETYLTSPSASNGTSDWASWLREKLDRTSDPGHVLEVLRELDDKRSGFIEADMFFESLKLIGVALSPDEQDALLSALDPAQTGRIDYVSIGSKLGLKRERATSLARAEMPMQITDWRSDPAVRNMLHALIADVWASREDLLSIFIDMDTAGTGAIGRSELRTALINGQMGVKVNMDSAELDDVLALFEDGAGGHVRYQIFYEALEEIAASGDITTARRPPVVFAESKGSPSRATGSKVRPNPRKLAKANPSTASADPTSNKENHQVDSAVGNRQATAASRRRAPKGPRGVRARTPTAMPSEPPGKEPAAPDTSLPRSGGQASLTNDSDYGTSNLAEFKTEIVVNAAVQPPSNAAASEDRAGSSMVAAPVQAAAAAPRPPKLDADAPDRASAEPESGRDGRRNSGRGARAPNAPGDDANTAPIPCFHAVADQLLPFKHRLRAAFRVADESGTGELEEGSIVSALNGLGVQLPPAGIDALVRAAASDGSRKVPLEGLLSALEDSWDTISAMSGACAAAKNALRAITRYLEAQEAPSAAALFERWDIHDQGNLSQEEFLAGLSRDCSYAVDPADEADVVSVFDDIRHGSEQIGRGAFVGALELAAVAFRPPEWLSVERCPEDPSCVTVTPGGTPSAASDLAVMASDAAESVASALAAHAVEVEAILLRLDPKRTGLLDARAVPRIQSELSCLGAAEFTAAEIMAALRGSGSGSSQDGRIPYGAFLAMLRSRAAQEVNGTPAAPVDFPEASASASRAAPLKPQPSLAVEELIAGLQVPIMRLGGVGSANKGADNRNKGTDNRVKVKRSQ